MYKLTLVLMLGGSELLAASGSFFGKVNAANDGRPLAEAVVFIDQVNNNSGFIQQNSERKMALRNMSFIPNVLPVLAGSTVSFPNDDTMVHNVYSLSKTKPFDVGIYQHGEQKSVTFNKSGLVIVYCNIHVKMAGYILVLGNPYFCQTDKDGTYHLKDVPPGSYSVICWSHENSSQTENIFTQTKTVTLGADMSSEVELNFKPSMVRSNANHKNKWGKDYNGKY